MISFIIIGRNEGWKLPKCLDSVIQTVNQNKIIEHEIVYVDSNSTDDSIEKAKKYKNVLVLKLTKDFNAAIARNIGVKVSKGEVTLDEEKFLKLFLALKELISELGG